MNQATQLLPGNHSGSNTKVRFRHWRRQSKIHKKAILIAKGVVR